MGTRPPDRRIRVVHRVHRPVGGGGGGRGPQGRVGDAEARLLALHVAAGLEVAGRVIDAEVGQGVAALLGRDADGEEHHEDGGHGGQDRPALPRVLDHHPERVAERGGDHQDREQLEEVGERRRILEGMGRIDVEEAAAVRAQLLDHDLRGGGPDGDDLLGELGLLGLGLPLVVQDGLALVVGHRLVVLDGLEDGGLFVGPEVLHHALGDEHERAHERPGAAGCRASSG